MVTITPFKVSFAITDVTTVLPDVTVANGTSAVPSSLAQIKLFIETLVAGDSQITEPVVNDVVTS